MATYLYSKDHEWALRDGNEIRVGISDYAQKELGDIAYVELPDIGSAVQKGEAACSIDSLKSSSEIFAPATGKIVAVNDVLHDEENCGIINEDPLGDGWIFRMELSNPADLDDLMNEEEYAKFTEDLH